MSFSLRIYWRDGRVETHRSGHDPRAVRAAAAGIAPNERLMDRIVLEDLTGPLDTLWARSWADLCGSSPAYPR